MATSSIFLSRTAKMFVHFDTSEVFEIPILEGYSFSQAMNTSEVTLSEANTAAGVSRRGRKLFNNSLAPVEFSFSTYVRPFVSNGDQGTTAGDADDAATTHGVEEVLWALMAGADTYTTGAFLSGSDVITAPAATVNPISFAHSNKAQLKTGAKLIFQLEEEDSDGGTLQYTITEIAINEATVDFDIEGIATIQWSGMGTGITEAANQSALTANIFEGVSSTTAFIQNRLSTLTLDPTDGQTGLDNAAYTLTLTGGSITISNNLTFLTPEELAVVNKPIGHVTGTRSVTGTLNCYLDDSGANTSAGLFTALAGATTLTQNEFALNIGIGGISGAPSLKFTVPQAHLQVPTHSFDDVVSLEVTFDGVPSTFDAADEISLTYKAA
jgi:hypothetical protein